jgi:site-specific recombinase XerD
MNLLGLRGRALIVVLYSTAIRNAEPLDLRFHDMDLDRRVVETTGGRPSTMAKVRSWS